MTELMKRLVDAGYPREEMDHHYTDLYVYVNDISHHCSITGREMSLTYMCTSTTSRGL